MPIYEYKCESCGHQVEILQKISDVPAKTCPACGEHALKKLVSAAAFKLKGTGWYETDFKHKKPKTTSKTGGAAGSKGKNSGSDSKSQPAKSADSTKSSGKKASSE